MHKITIKPIKTNSEWWTLMLLLNSEYAQLKMRVPVAGCNDCLCKAGPGCSKHR